MNQKHELFEILKELKRGNKMAAEAYDEILLLFNVVGQSEQYCDWCSSTEEVEVTICKKCRQGMDDHR